MSKMNKDFSYPDPEEDDLLYKIFKKREFYYHRVPERDIMKTYDDVQKYRADNCPLPEEPFNPREQQAIVPNLINPNTPYNGVILMHGTGSGKCHKKDTLIMMYDTSLKKVQDIKVGDLLMGDDGDFRTVIELSKGVELLYKVIPEQGKGTPYYVNSNHILTLINYDGKIIDCPIKDYLDNSNNLKGFRVSFDRNPDNLNYIGMIVDRFGSLYTNYYQLNLFMTNKALENFNYIVNSSGLYFDMEYKRIYGPIHIIPSMRFKPNEFSDDLTYNIRIEKDIIDEYYGFAVDKNHRYLLSDMTVTHNSCSAISIAEQFKEQIKRYNTKIYVLVPGPNTRENFKGQLIYCTGETYLKNKEELKQMTKQEVDREERLAINSALQYYKILSYKAFHKKVLGEKIVEKKLVDNKLIKSTYRKSAEGEIEREIVVDKITNMNNTILIVDEAHNLSGNEYGEALKKIIKNSENLKVVLLTATPMINLADEIVDLLNFIRPLNDQVDRDKIFTNEKNYNMKVKPGGLEYLRTKARGYISFYRGNIPYTFAKRVEKGVVPKDMLFTPVIKCFMEKFQHDTYIDTIKKDGLETDLSQKENRDKSSDLLQSRNEDTLYRGASAAANFVYPGLNKERNDLKGYYSAEGLTTIMSQLNSDGSKLRGLINKKIFNSKLNKHEEDNFILPGEKGNITGEILKLKFLKHFSVKFYKMILRLNKLIVGRKGPKTAFVYSNLVNAGGIELFAEAMKQNGYLEYNDNPRDYDIKDDTIDYKTGLTFYEFKKKKLTDFKPATFILVTGGTAEEGEEVPEVKQKIIRNIYNSPDNIDGKHIKLVLGSKVMNEGVTLKNCSEVHILDSFYNIPKAEQVIGRAIRMCVHQDSINDNNKFPKVYVYRYVVSLKNQLSTDEILYQKAELKYLIVKQIERLLKEVAVDCPLLLHANLFPEELEKYKDCYAPTPENIKAGKQICPALCDFKKCNLKCEDKKLNDNYWSGKGYRYLNKNDIDYNTFNDDLSKYEVNMVKSKIKELYRFKYVYVYSELLEELQKSLLYHQKDLFDKLFLDQALEDLMPKTENDFNKFKDTIYDKYNRPGYLIQRDQYYIYQPFDENEQVPMYYRENINIKQENQVSLDNYIQQKYKEIAYKDPLEKKMLKKEAYDFESVLDYYQERDENFIVGIIDKNTNKLAFQQTDLFKVREPRAKILSKKRGTGIPTFKGAVCANAKERNYLLKVNIKLDKIMDDSNVLSIYKKFVKDNDLTKREDICNKIKDKLLFLEKYASDKGGKITIPKMTYVMIPKNHLTLEFPYNLQDRIKYNIKQINKLVERSVDIEVIKKEKDNLPYYQLTFDNEKYLSSFNNQLEKIGFKLDGKKWIKILE